MRLTPELEGALQKLAGTGSYTTADALLAIQAAAAYRDKVWPTLTPQQKYALLVRMRHLREANRRRRRASELR